MSTIPGVGALDFVRVEQVDEHRACTHAWLLAVGVL